MFSKYLSTAFRNITDIDCLFLGESSLKRFNSSSDGYRVRHFKLSSLAKLSCQSSGRVTIKEGMRKNLFLLNLSSGDHNLFIYYGKLVVHIIRIATVTDANTVLFQVTGFRILGLFLILVKINSHPHSALVVLKTRTRDRFYVSGKVACVKKPLGGRGPPTNNPTELTPILCSYLIHTENSIGARFSIRGGLNFGVHIGVYNWYKKG